MQRRDDGGLGTQLVGDRIHVNHKCVQVSKLLGEGGFSYVYLVKEISDGAAHSATTTSTQASDTAGTTARTAGTSSNGTASAPSSSNPFIPDNNVILLKRKPNFSPD